MKLFVTERKRFPNPRLAHDEGIVDVGDKMSVEDLLEAYSFGIFPWPHEDFPVLWFSPPERGVLDFKDFHVSKSLAKTLRKCSFRVSYNREFERVIEACSKVPRPGQNGTWITPQLKSAYVRFHQAGYAHSVECWDVNNQLVGGLYGVYVGGVFAAESMFRLQDNASQFCLVRLIENLRDQGLTWMDIQMVTPHLEKMGGRYITREEFLERLTQVQSQAKPLQFKNQDF